MLRLSVFLGTHDPLRAASAAAPPAQSFTVLAPQPDGPRITPYLAYQTEMAWRQDDRRRARLASVRTEADLLRLQAELRTKLLRMLGGLPSTRTPLNAQITGRIQMAGYHIEKLIFESLPGIFVTALVYVPMKGARRIRRCWCAPGIPPTARRYYQALCQRLALRGYVVIAWDPVGQGERSQFWDAARGRSRYNLICGEHAILGNLAYLAGANLARWEVWDGMRALDYLLTRPEVDHGRISITGTSGGGFQTALIAALDPRIQTSRPRPAISPPCPMRVGNRIFKDPDSDPEQDPRRHDCRRRRSRGLDAADLPTPGLRRGRGTRFLSDRRHALDVSRGRRVYRRFGHRGPHRDDRGLPRARVLGGEPGRRDRVPRSIQRPSRAPDLPATSELDDRTLQVTRTGQVLLDHPDGRSLLGRDPRLLPRSRQ